MAEAIRLKGAHRHSGHASWSIGILRVAIALFAVIALGTVAAATSPSAHAPICGPDVTGVEGAVADSSSGSCPESLDCPFQACAQSAALPSAEGPPASLLAGWEKPSAAPHIRSRWRAHYRPPRGAVAV